MKTIVISAVNLNVGGTLTILRECLSYLSKLASENDIKIIAIVHDKELAYYNNIEYLEFKWPKKSWINRLWFEYYYLKNLSKNIGVIDLWLSLHDTSPNVKAIKKAVYCHNPFPFYNWKFKELFFAPKIVLFSLFSVYIYKINIYDNNFIIVQQQWIKDKFKKIFKIPNEKIIIAIPNKDKNIINDYSYHASGDKIMSFLYPASANSHKNFECLCKAAIILEKNNICNFRIIITIDGTENKYSKWLFKNWGQFSKTIKFIGFQDKLSLNNYYSQSDCLIFPSKIETWGLPISEYSNLNKPMLLANLPYAYETAAGSNQVAFFNPDNPNQLATMIKSILDGEMNFLQEVPAKFKEEPNTNSWEELFTKLLEDS